MPFPSPPTGSGNEITVRASLQVRKGNVFYQSQPTGFNANLQGSQGPNPGFILATTAGVSIAFTVTKGGLCFITNIDPSTSNNFCVMGLFDPDTNEFYPIADFYPGEETVIRLSQYLGQEFAPSPGTGSTGRGVTLMFKGVGGSVQMRVEAFDR